MLLFSIIRCSASTESIKKLTIPRETLARKYKHYRIVSLISLYTAHIICEYQKRHIANEDAMYGILHPPPPLSELSLLYPCTPHRSSASIKKNTSQTKIRCTESYTYIRFNATETWSLGRLWTSNLKFSQASVIIFWKTCNGNFQGRTELKIIH